MKLPVHLAPFLSSFKSPFKVLSLVCALGITVSGLALAQDNLTDEATDDLPVGPSLLSDALVLPVCEDYLVAEKTDPQAADAPVAVQPQGASEQSVFVFDLSAAEPAVLIDMMRFEDIETVSAEVGSLPLTSLDAVSLLTTGVRPPLYGWMVVHFDAAGQPLCRSTGYPAVAGQTPTEPLALVNFQGFIAQMVSTNKLIPTNYQPGELCTFETPQYCESIFMGDEQTDVVEGTEGADLISTGAGNDSVNANAGNDVVSGGLGGDVINGGDGDDVIYGDGGDDLLSGGNGDDIIRGGDGNDLVTGDQGVDTVSGDNGIDTVRQDS